MTAALTKQPSPPQKFVEPSTGALTFEANNWFHRLLQLLDNAEINVTTTVVQLFEPKTLTGAAATIYTTPVATSNQSVPCLAKAKVRFSNVTGGAITVTAYAVPAGGAASDTGNAFMVGESIAANSHVDVDLPMLGPGDFFQAKAGAGTSIVCTALAGTLFT